MKMTIKMKLVKIVVLVCCVLSYHRSKADIPSFDIAKIEINGQHYFLTYETRGLIISEDFCYYATDSKYLCDANVVIAGMLSRSESQVYKELHVIELNKFPGYSWEGNERLFILKREVVIDSIKFQGEFNLISITRGNTAGYIYSNDLSDADNYWIQNKPIEMFFKLESEGICEMHICGIKGALGPQEKQDLKKHLTEVLRKSYLLGLQRELKKLYSRNIIMIGFCSC